MTIASCLHMCGNGRHVLVCLPDCFIDLLCDLHAYRHDCKACNRYRCVVQPFPNWYHRSPGLCVIRGALSHITGRLADRTKSGTNVHVVDSHIPTRGISSSSGQKLRGPRYRPRKSPSDPNRLIRDRAALHSRLDTMAGCIRS